MKSQFVIYKLLIFIALMLCACDDMDDKNPSATTDSQTDGLIVLCEGLFNMNNSSLFVTDGNSATYNAFETVNGRKIGDTANSMIVYGNKIYIAGELCISDIFHDIEKYGDPAAVVYGFAAETVV